MNKTFAAVMALAASLYLACAPAAASSSAIWTQSGAETFFRGELENMSLTSDGFITLGLQSEKTLDSTEPFIWSVAEDGQGNVFAGSGNKAVLYKIGPKESSQVAMLPGVGITALAPAGGGDMLAGIFPSGEIHQVSPSGRDRLLTTLPGQYIWALKPQKDGFIAAAGSPAGVYSFSAKGEIKNLARPAERHILCLDTDEDGNIYAGSSPNGLVYRIDAKTQKLSVVADFNEEEIYRILYIGGGRMLVAANRDQAPVQAQAQGGPGGRQMPQENPTLPISFPVSYDAPPNAPPPLPSSIYLLKTSGEVRRLFTFADPYILSLKKLDDTRYVAGTGNRGGIYTFNIETLDATMDRLPARQILDILIGDKGTRYFATGGPGAVFSFKPRRQSSGSYVSVPNDTYGIANWGVLRAEALVPDKTRIDFSTRTGNTSDPDDGTWSDWATVPAKLPSEVPSPPARYIQYRAAMSASDTKDTPVVKEVSIAYLTANRPPEIIAAGVSPQPQKRTPPQQDQAAAAAARSSVPAVRAAAPPDPLQESNIQVGTLTAAQEVFVRWQAQDPDGDSIRYTIGFRRLPTAQWSMLSQEFYGSELRWPTESVPDGKYEVKITATDAPSNPEDKAFTEFKITEPFIIDNSRPALTAELSHPKKDIIVVSGTVTDPTSIISGIEYSLDDLKWKTVFPDDLIFDSQSERFTIEFGALTAGNHTIIVRARDFVGNTSSQSLPFALK